MSVIDELKRRNVFRIATAYAVVAWLLIQVAETLFPLFGFDDTPARMVVIVLAIGFIPALIFAWIFELTPEGLKRDKDVDRSSAASQDSTKRLDRGIIIVLVLALAYFAFDKFVLTPQREASQMEEVSVQVEQARQEGRSEAVVESYGDQSIAVLAFEDMSPNKDQEYLADGVAEELLNLLVKIPGLRVISRTSAFSFKGRSVQIPNLASQLNVAYVLEGSIRKAGDRVRITAQLIDAHSDTHLWSESYDRKLDDIFAIQDEIARVVVDKLRLTLVDETPNAQVVNTEALELSLRGRFLLNRRNPGDLESALEYFEQAVAIDPSVASAWVGLAPLYIWLFDPPRLEDAQHAVDQAIELEPNNAEAWVRRGMIAITTGDHDEGQQHMLRALELGPDNPLALAINASNRENKGNIQGSIELLKRAVAVDPMHIVNQQYLISMLMTAGCLELARERLVHAQTLLPDARILVGVESRLNLLIGHPEKALKSITKAGPVSRDQGQLSDAAQMISAMAHHDLGNTAASDEALDRLAQSSGVMSNLDQAMVHAWRGEPDEAFQSLELARQQSMFYLLRGKLLSPEFASLHSDPRWEPMMTQVGFADPKIAAEINNSGLCPRPDQSTIIF